MVSGVASPQTEKFSSGNGLRLVQRICLELAFIFAAIAAVKFGGEGYIPNLGRSIFWFPVILLSLQYGLAAGLFAAVASTLFAWTADWPEPQFLEEHFDFWIREWLQPCLWLVAAVIIGGLRQQQIVAQTVLANSLQQSNERASALADHAGQLTARVKHLERAIAISGGSSGEAICHALDELCKATPPELEETLSNCVEALFGAQAYALKTYDQTQSLHIDNCGGKEGRRGNDDSLTILFYVVCKRQRVISIFNPADIPFPGSEFSLAGPISLAEDGRVIGVLGIRQISQDAQNQVHIDYERRLRLLCQVLSDSLSRHYAKFAARKEKAAVVTALRPLPQRNPNDHLPAPASTNVAKSPSMKS